MSALVPSMLSFDWYGARHVLLDRYGCVIVECADPIGDMLCEAQRFQIKGLPLVCEGL